LKNTGGGREEGGRETGREGGRETELKYSKQASSKVSGKASRVVVTVKGRDWAMVNVYR
jgi:hypothetical protein